MYVTDAEAPLLRSGEIRLYDEAGFEGMRVAGRLVAECLDMLVGKVQPGVETGALDDLIREFVFDNGAQSATIGYRGYQHASCISPNHVICHGIPGPKRLKEGDIANIDVTLIVDGWHGDHSRMFGVGEVKRKGTRLMDLTYEAMMAGIAQIKPGNRVADISKAITKIAHANRLSVVEDFCGHGLGRLFHDEPNVMHAWGPFPQMRRDSAGNIVKISEEEAYEESPLLEPGMFFTVEPMLNLGRKSGTVLKDGWTAVTTDKKLSAQYEHSCGVTETGVEIFTTSPKGYHTPHTVEL